MLEEYFSTYRQNIVGINLKSEHYSHNLLYTDWTASGRLYRPIETHLTETIGPYVANPHTENTETGQYITQAYKAARAAIKSHVNANHSDVLICTGSGATSAINKLQRLIGLSRRKVEHRSLPSKFLSICKRAAKLESIKSAKPVVFITHMEHHSNQTTWNILDVIVEVIARAPDGQPCLNDLKNKLLLHKDAPLKIGSFTACSNVTGISTDIHLLAKTMHQHGGVCFADYACSAPYVKIDMHPQDEEARLDGIFFSPHKFLGGPGSCGILIFNRSLYKNDNCAPDKPGGGTVKWTNPWGEQAFYEDIEKREDGGTPGFMQTIKAALAIQLKDKMGVGKIHAREAYLRQKLMSGLEKVPSLRILEPNNRERLCIVSFYVESLHHNLIVRLLNDKFGIQSRGGCSCAGTYGHILLDVDKHKSAKIVGEVGSGNLTNKPGWVRISMHPTHTDAEVEFVIESVAAVVKNAKEWQKDYRFEPQIGDFVRHDQKANSNPSSLIQTEQTQKKRA